MDESYRVQRPEKSCLNCKYAVLIDSPRSLDTYCEYELMLGMRLKREKVGFLGLCNRWMLGEVRRKEA